MKKALWLMMALAMTLGLMLPLAADAEEEERQCAPGVICIGDQIIYGKVHRPNAFYVINRSQLRHQETQQDENFTSEVVESVDSGPF